MDDKLVTLAIRTYQRAQMIKVILEDNGIETLIHNLNIENPEMAVGVRIRIKESDLPRALKIVEEKENAWEVKTEKVETKRVLIPIDFADQVENSIDYGFHFAKNLNAEIVFIYVYFSPAFTISVNNDISTYNLSDSELLRRILSNAKADIENMKNLLNNRIEKGELPKIKFEFELIEGVPEDQILEYCKKHKPYLVVMGTHGKKSTTEYIGSVTAEVIESSLSPVFAVPLKDKKNTPNQIKKVAFLTNFDQKDLIAIDKCIELFKNNKMEMYFIHAAEKNQVWDEIMLAGIKTYFENHYPTLKTNYAIISSSNNPELIDNFLKTNNIDLLAFNSRRRKLFSRLFNPGLAYKMVNNSDTPLFVTYM